MTRIPFVAWPLTLLVLTIGSICLGPSFSKFSLMVLLVMLAVDVTAKERKPCVEPPSPEGMLR